MRKMLKNKRTQLGIVSAVIIVGILVLFFINRPVSIDDWNKLDSSVSNEKVEEIIGKPKKRLTDTRDMLDAVNMDHENYYELKLNMMLVNDDSKEIKRLNRSIEEELEILDALHKGITDGEDVTVHSYQVKSDNDTSEKHVYFYRGSIFHITGEEIK